MIRLYAVARAHGTRLEVLGVVQGAGTAYEAAMVAQRVWPRVGTVPWHALTDRQRETARAGRVLEVNPKHEGACP